jgi:heme oxygenase
VAPDSATIDLVHLMRPPPAGLAAELRRTTRPEHQLVERRLGLPDSLCGPEDLVALLVLWRQVWSTVVAAVPPPVAAGSPELFATATRSQLLITADLDALAAEGFAAGPIARPTSTPISASTLLPLTAQIPDEIPDARIPDSRVPAPDSFFWGTMYVLLGSRLGGALIARSVADRCAPVPGGSLRFLRSDGVDVHGSWREFLGELGAWADGRPPVDHERVLAAASATFATVNELATVAGWDGHAPRRDLGGRAHQRERR